MPSRLLVIGIILFWLATLGWVVQREVLPRLRAGQPPPLYLDLEDEVGGRVILWEVYNNGDRIGTAQTKAAAKPGRRFELLDEMSLTGLNIGPVTPFGRVSLRRVNDAYRIGPDGTIESFAAMFKVLIGEVVIEAHMKGDVVDGVLTPKLTLKGMGPADGPDIPLFKPRPLVLSGEKRLLGVLRPQHRINGLYAGRTWMESDFNPLEGTFLNYLATVSEAKLPGDEGVPCWRIDVAEPGKSPVTQVWVRRSDGLVLQHEANSAGYHLVFRRAPDR